MEDKTEIHDLVCRCIPHIRDDHPSEMQVESRSLPGGLEAVHVALITVRYKTGLGKSKSLRIVCKKLAGRATREAAVYERLAAKGVTHLSPKLIAVEPIAPGEVILCLEAVRRYSAWPWRDVKTGEELLTVLALFHLHSRQAAIELPEWDYDAELTSMAEASWITLDRCRFQNDLTFLARGLAPLKRMVLGLPKIRHQLLCESPLAQGPIHGDVHPGNALVCRRSCRDRPVLVDWGRARTGSTLEDVSSWLQSLGYFEQNARRHHDRLFAGYLSVLGFERRLTSNIRASYWMAGASNALAGALRHHLAIAQDQQHSERRRALAIRMANDWLRVIRRADAWWS